MGVVDPSGSLTSTAPIPPIVRLGRNFTTVPTVPFTCFAATSMLLVSMTGAPGAQGQRLCACPCVHSGCRLPDVRGRVAHGRPHAALPRGEHRRQGLAALPSHPIDAPLVVLVDGLVPCGQEQPLHGHLEPGRDAALLHKVQHLFRDRGIPNNKRDASALIAKLIRNANKRKQDLPDDRTVKPLKLMGYDGATPATKADADRILTEMTKEAATPQALDAVLQTLEDSSSDSDAD